jgi:hypothetical protein
MPDNQQKQHAKRDAETFIMMGIFFLIMAVLLLIGMAWESMGPGMIVGLASGGVLLLVAAACMAIALFLKRRSA